MNVRQELLKLLIDRNFNGKQAEFARRVGIRPTQINQWLNGFRNMGEHSARAIEKTLGLAPLWLDTPIQEELAKVARQGEAYNIHSENKHELSEVDIRGSVPLISWVQAGNWSECMDLLTVGDGERITTTYKARKHTYALKVQGDSMQPLFPNGCIIIVEPDEEPVSGRYVIVRQGGDVTFKQLMQDGSKQYLKPLNTNYPIMQLNEDAVFCGVVKRMEMDV